MTTTSSANNSDPSLFLLCIGGPRDGLRTGDLPSSLSGTSLAGMTLRLPLAQPAHVSLFAVYECVGDEQVDGFWQFHYVTTEGPDGETLVAAGTTPEPAAHDLESSVGPA